MQVAAVPFFLLENAIGQIQPDEKQASKLEEFTNRVGSGEFLRPTETMIVCDCIDGRGGSVGALRPNAAGGSESLMVADDLTSKSFRQGDHASTCDQYETTLNYLYANAYPVGGHTCEGIAGTASGCGANDKLPAIYEFIARHGDELRTLAGELGASADDETHGMIVKNAAERSQFSSGAELLEALKSHREARVSTLKGTHREVMALVNMRPFTTLDRDAVRDEFGDDYQAFNVDVWAFPKSAKIISTDDRDQQQKLAAMIYYNLATTCVLVGPTLRIVVVK